MGSCFCRIFLTYVQSSVFEADRTMGRPKSQTVTFKRSMYTKFAAHCHDCSTQHIENETYSISYTVDPGGHIG